MHHQWLFAVWGKCVFSHQIPFFQSMSLRIYQTGSYPSVLPFPSTTQILSLCITSRGSSQPTAELALWQSALPVWYSHRLMLLRNHCFFAILLQLASSKYRRVSKLKCPLLLCYDHYPNIC